jgi:hypothetical protein
MRTLARWPLGGAVLLACLLASSSCKDAREASTGPEITGLDGGDIFGITFVTATIYRHQNEMAARVLELIEAGNTLPVSQPGCRGTGNLEIRLQGNDPNERRLVFTNYWIECGGEVEILVNGEMLIEFFETSPGLRYTITNPFAIDADFVLVPLGPTYTLDANAGGLNLDVTGQLECELDATARRHAGGVHQTGTMRLEDRGAFTTVVQEVDIEFEFDEELQPPFSNWPAGSIELASFTVQPFSGGLPSIPIHVTFDGFGGMAFRLDGRDCNANLATGDNPCEGL